MNCPFNESKIKMNDDDFMRKLNSQSIQSSPSNFDTQYFTPSELSDEQDIGVKKSCPCSNGGNGNDNNIPSDGNIIGDIKGKAGELMDSFISMFKTIAGKKDIYKAIQE